MPLFFPAFLVAPVLALAFLVMGWGRRREDDPRQAWHFLRATIFTSLTIVEWVGVMGAFHGENVLSNICGNPAARLVTCAIGILTAANLYCLARPSSRAASLWLYWELDKPAAEPKDELSHRNRDAREQQRKW